MTMSTRMRLDRGSKFKVSIAALALSACVAVDTGLRDQAFADDQEPQTEEVDAGSEMPLEKSLASSDESRDGTKPREFAGLDTLRQGPIYSEVRVAQPAELKKLGLITSDEAMAFVVGGSLLIAGGFGAAALPLLLAHLAVHGYLLAWVPAGKALEGHRRAMIAESLAEVDFPSLTQTALRHRLKAEAAVSEETTERRVRVVVLGYGFMGDQGEKACSFLHAQIRLDLPGHDTQEDEVFIEPYRRSDDAPPAYCTRAKRLFANNSELARRTLTESAEILAAIIARRLEER